MFILRLAIFSVSVWGYALALSQIFWTNQTGVNLFTQKKQP